MRKKKYNLENRKHFVYFAIIYTQIAYNPDDVESVRLVIDYYKKKFRQEAKEMDLDEYFGTAGPGGMEYLNELAAKGYEGRMHEEQLAEI